MTSKAILLFICFFIPLICGLALGKTINFMIEQNASVRSDKPSRIGILFLFYLTTYYILMVALGCGNLAGGLL